MMNGGRKRVSLNHNLLNSNNSPPQKIPQISQSGGEQKETGFFTRLSITG